MQQRMPPNRVISIAGWIRNTTDFKTHRRRRPDGEQHQPRRFILTLAISCLAVALLLLTAAPSAHAQEWRFGVGSGFTFTNIQGDQGYTLSGPGPIQYELDLDPEDVSDLMQSAFGFAGYATDGNWIVQYAFIQATLGGDGQANLPAEVGGGYLDYDLAFDMTQGKLTVGRTAYRSDNMKFSFTPYAGIRVMAHELSADLVITQQDVPTYIYRSRDYTWADAVVGFGIGYWLTPKLN